MTKLTDLAVKLNVDPMLDVAMKFSEGIKLKQFVYATQVKTYLLKAKKWLDPTKFFGIVGFVHPMADKGTPCKRRRQLEGGRGQKLVKIADFVYEWSLTFILIMGAKNRFVPTCFENVPPGP
jgi:hypothetical protein